MSKEGRQTDPAVAERRFREVLHRMEGGSFYTNADLHQYSDMINYHYATRTDRDERKLKRSRERSGTKKRGKDSRHRREA